MNTLFLGLLAIIDITLSVASNHDHEFLRRLGKPACNDGTCRSSCDTCPNGVELPSGDPCCGTTTTSSTTTVQTNPFCPTGATSCVCQDESTACSFDQDCPDDEVVTAGVCDKGSNSGLPCEYDIQCPQGKGYATCGSSITITPGVCTEVIIPDDNCCTDWCRQTEVYGDYMTRAGPGDWYEPPHPTDGSGNFNTNFCACGGTYKATCAINAWDIQWKQSGTATVGDYCNEMVNMYAPCNSDNGNTVCDNFVDQAGEDIWNDCALGTIDITGSVDTNGVCKCSATVSDGNGDGSNIPHTQPVWDSNCGDNSNLSGDAGGLAWNQDFFVNTCGL